jgi:c-di-GMP-binding flagellar brake protein YcgR
MDKEVIEKFNNIGNDMLTQISNVTLPSNYYIQNRKHYRIKVILDGYNFINNEVSKNLKQNEEFNPSMLYFSLLAVWFKELNKESKSKEYIYFILYPYANAYDKFLVEIKNKEFKQLNIKMIELAEKIILKFDKYSF